MKGTSATQQVDDSFIVRSKEPYGVFEEQHEGRVDHSVGQLVRIGLQGGGEREKMKEPSPD